MAREKAQKGKSMSKLGFVAWLAPWVLAFLAACGLGLVASEMVRVSITGEHWLNAEWVLRIGWMSGVYMICFIVFRVLLEGNREPPYPRGSRR